MNFANNVSRQAERLRVLVVEDDPAYRDLAREVLTGHERWIVSDAQSAVETFRDQLPDVTFLDLSLPDDHGLEVLLQMREIQPEAFIVVLTASRMTDDVRLAQRCGANGYIIKPFSRKQLRAYCDACVEHWERMDGRSVQQREDYCSAMRRELDVLHGCLHTPNAEAREALRHLMPRWPVLIAGNRQSPASVWSQLLVENNGAATYVDQGKSALQEVGEKPYRMLVVHDSLPDMEAAELIYRLRLNQHSVPVMVVVDAPWKLQQQKWKRVGAQRIISEPVAAERVLVMIEKAMMRDAHEARDIFLKC